MKLQYLLMASAAMISFAGGATAAHAADLAAAPMTADTMVSAPYVEFGAGVNFSGVSLGDVTRGSTSLPFIVTQPNNFGVGGIIYGALGAELMPGLRGEVEASYRGNSGAKFSVVAEGTGNVGVDSTTFMLMANFWKDFDLEQGVSVHVGGGVGIGEQSLTTTGATPSPLSRTGLAGMLGIGADYAIGNNMKLTVDYRVSGISGSFGRSDIASDDPENDDKFSGQFSTSLDQSITAGLRIPIGN
jgi:opacity protein-like surface antigen